MFVCNFCSCLFSKEVDWFVHLIQKHRFNKAKKSFKCPICHFSFSKLLPHFDRFHSDTCIVCLKENGEFENHEMCEKKFSRAMFIYSMKEIFDVYYDF